MNLVGLCLAGIAVLAAIGLMLWVGRAMAMADDELRTFIGIEGMHFNE